MIPHVSPFGLIQESLWPNEWRILVACILLNCTTRKSVEKIMPRLFREYPGPRQMRDADESKLSELIAPLGFKNRRSKTLMKMSKAYLSGNWCHVRELPGIGDYAADAWEIFILGKLPDRCPKDHALTAYYTWRKSHGY